MCVYVCVYVCVCVGGGGGGYSIGMNVWEGGREGGGRGEEERGRKGGGGWSTAEFLQRRCQVVRPTNVENLTVEPCSCTRRSVVVGGKVDTSTCITSDTGQFLHGHVSYV